MSIVLGSSLSADEITEGDDIYFNCLIKSKSNQHKSKWIFNVSTNINFITETVKSRNYF